MRIVVAQTEKVTADPVASPDKRAPATRPDVRPIRLDRRIRQAEWAERLQGRF